MTKKLIVISPGYLHAARTELDKYSFSICGYGNADLAYKKLICINKRDVIGCLMVYDELPTKEIKYIKRFLEIFFRIYKLPVVLCTTKQIASQQMSEIQKYGKVVCHTSDEVTDVVFSKAIAYILMQATFTYKFQPDEVKQLVKLPVFNTYKLMTDDQLAVLSEVSKRNTFEGTLKYDVALKQLENNKDLRILRLARILTLFEKNTLGDSQLNNILDALFRLESNEDMFVRIASSYFVGEINDRL